MSNNYDHAIAAGAKLTNAGATMSVGGGVWVWLAENQQAIAALCAILGVSIALAGFIWSRINERRREQEEREFREQYIQSLHETFKRSSP